MKKFVLLGLLFFQSIFALDFTCRYASEHMEIACCERDLEICDQLLEDSEKMWERLSQEFHHHIDHKIQVFLFPDIHSFHQAIHRENAPDWLICSSGSAIYPIQMVSPLNPGPYHSSENVRKALLRGIIQAFIYDKFKECNAPWWLIAGVTAKKVDWPYARSSISLPGIIELEEATYTDTGMGWFALSFTSYIERKYGWNTILQLLEDYTHFEQVTRLSKDQLILEWQSSVENEL